MKSIFQEESSLGKAVQKAWDSLGNPLEFSVKVLKVGEFGFFGFCKVPFTVCLTVGQEKIVDEQSLQEKGKGSVENKKLFSLQQNKKDSGCKKIENIVENKKYGKRCEDKTNELTIDFKDSSERIFCEKNLSDDWTEDLVDKAVGFITEAVLLLGHEVSRVEPNFEKNNLRLLVTLSDFDSNLDKTILFALAPIIVQMVRKSTKNSVRGLRLTIDVTKKTF